MLAYALYRAASRHRARTLASLALRRGGYMFAVDLSAVAVAASGSIEAMAATAAAWLCIGWTHWATQHIASRVPLG